MSSHANLLALHTEHLARHAKFTEVLLFTRKNSGGKSEEEKVGTPISLLVFAIMNVLDFEPSRWSYCYDPVKSVYP